MERRESNGSQAFDMTRAAMESWVATFAFHLFFPDGDFIRAAMSEEGNKSKDKQGKTT